MEKLFVPSGEELVTEEVMPCPLCGGRNITVDTEEFYDKLIPLIENGTPLVTMGCLDCDLVLRNFNHGTDYKSKRIALIDRWNKRELVNDAIDLCVEVTVNV